MGAWIINHPDRKFEGIKQLAFVILSRPPNATNIGFILIHIHPAEMSSSPDNFQYSTPLEPILAILVELIV